MDILAFEPFAGDRDMDIRLLDDRMRVARKAHRCVNCTGPIVAGERVRTRVEIDRDDDVLMTFRFCALCCEAMAKEVTDPDDAGRAIGARSALAIPRSEIP